MTGKIGLAPGSAVYTGDKAPQKALIRVVSYAENSIDIAYGITPDRFDPLAYTQKGKVTWVHVEPISDAQSISKIGTIFGLHPLVVEDILSISHRPKAEVYDDYLFIITKQATYRNQTLQFSQVSFVLTDDYLLSFADETDDRFEAIVKRLRKDGTRIRKSGSAYLLFALMDYIMDAYFEILEKIGDELEDLEDEILNNPSKETIVHVHALKQTLMQLKKNIWPMRELLNTLIRSDEIDPGYHIYFRDIYDHVINIMDIIEGYRDTSSSFLDIYLSTLGNRMNEIMKTLSIISTIFIPLSFITGYFGMNFAAMADGILKSSESYTYSNIAMLIIPVTLLVYFKIRKWF
ncbi:MAG TPA: magnesium/cobalt transporter CorA [Epsilonproteobacteria bacterium]|nr:magnesium/cobalt transporter CorA [Campylobacterota bacterium]